MAFRHNIMMTQSMTSFSQNWLSNKFVIFLKIILFFQYCYMYNLYTKILNWPLDMDLLYIVQYCVTSLLYNVQLTPIIIHLHVSDMRKATEQHSSWMLVDYKHFV